MTTKEMSAYAEDLYIFSAAFEEITTELNPKLYAGLLASIISDYARDNKLDPNEVVGMVVGELPKIRKLSKD